MELFLQIEQGKWKTPIVKSVERNYSNMVTRLNRIQNQIHLVDRNIKGCHDFLVNIKLAKYGNYNKILKLKKSYSKLADDLRETTIRDLWLKTQHLFDNKIHLECLKC